MKKRYSIADNPYSIPSDSGLDDLNSLLRSILKDDFESKDELREDLDTVEFDFYVNGTFLDTSIDNLLKTKPEIRVVSKTANMSSSNRRSRYDIVDFYRNHFSKLNTLSAIRRLSQWTQ